MAVILRSGHHPLLLLTQDIFYRPKTPVLILGGVYLVFKKMLERGHPPDDWDELLAAAKGEIDRLDNVNLEI